MLLLLLLPELNIASAISSTGYSTISLVLADVPAPPPWLLLPPTPAGLNSMESHLPMATEEVIVLDVNGSAAISCDIIAACSGKLDVGAVADM
ncbi:hypothetical protein PanWU01x14_075850 [Parasponia andersonii]|uniref:Secreted protein n=1 Tax=Parasponia andersonii TaxID=3476 RepID=A0A2P5DCX5_PARAD|nr:hypothetical protein PanWU01x14_075850 [Parasponia andersonii]